MSAMNEKLGERAPNAPFSQPASINSSFTHVPDTNLEKSELQQHNLPGHGESALPEDKQGEEIENVEDDWECSPENARNWPAKQKWTAVAIVCIQFPAMFNDGRSSLFANYTGFFLHLRFSFSFVNDGSRNAGGRHEIRHHQ